jgi:hypothetical protein
MSTEKRDRPSEQTPLCPIPSLLFLCLSVPCSLLAHCCPVRGSAHSTPSPRTRTTPQERGKGEHGRRRGDDERESTQQASPHVCLPSSASVPPSALCSFALLPLLICAAFLFARRVSEAGPACMPTKPAERSSNRTRIRAPLPSHSHHCSHPSSPLPLCCSASVSLTRRSEAENKEISAAPPRKRHIQSQQQWRQGLRQRDRKLMHPRRAPLCCLFLSPSPRLAGLLPAPSGRGTVPCGGALSVEPGADGGCPVPGKNEHL